MNDVSEALLFNVSDVMQLVKAEAAQRLTCKTWHANMANYHYTINCETRSKCL